MSIIYGFLELQVSCLLTPGSTLVGPKSIPHKHLKKTSFSQQNLQQTSMFTWASPSA